MAQIAVTPKALTITNQSALAATRANTANVLEGEEALRFTAQRGQKIFIPNKTRTRNGIVRGLHVIMDLRTAANAVISRNSKVHVYVKRSGRELGEPVRSLPYAIWYDLSTADQRNEDFRGRLAEACDLNEERGLVLNEDDALVFKVESADVVDWTKSYVELVVGEVNR